MGHWKKTAWEAGWVVLLALALACSAYAFRPHALPILPGDGDDMGLEADSSDGIIATISVEEAQDYLEQGRAIFADARALALFNAGHIRGALHLDPMAFDDWSSRVFTDIAPDEMVITYCDNDQCSLSHELAEKFIWLGFEKVRVLKGGWGAWQSRDLPVDQVLTSPEQ